MDVGCVLDGKTFTEGGPEERELGLNKFNQRLKTPIAVAADQAITVWHETIETKRSTDIAHFVFGHPTKDPLVTFRSLVPNTDENAMIANIRFNCRHREQRAQIGRGTFRMQGTLNPYQSIELRWFRIRDYREWAEGAEVPVS